MEWYYKLSKVFIEGMLSYLKYPTRPLTSSPHNTNIPNKASINASFFRGPIKSQLNVFPGFFLSFSSMEKKSVWVVVSNYLLSYFDWKIKKFVFFCQQFFRESQTNWRKELLALKSFGHFFPNSIFAQIYLSWLAFSIIKQTRVDINGLGICSFDYPRAA